jgi:DNA-binding NarL/FixJ family response regulator
MDTELSILIVDKRRIHGRQLGLCLAKLGVKADFQTMTTAEQVVAALNLLRWDLVVCSLAGVAEEDPEEVDAWEVLAFTKVIEPNLPIIVVGDVDPQQSIELMLAGVRDVLPASSPSRLAAAIKREIESRLVRSWLAEVAD